MSEEFKWGERPPAWFMDELATALQQMGQGGQLVHGFDTKEFSFFQLVCPVALSEKMAAAIGKAYVEVAGAPEAEGAPPVMPTPPVMLESPIDFREFCFLAINGLNKKDARRVGRMLDVAIAYGAIEYSRGNPSLQDIPTVMAAAKEKIEKEGRAPPRRKH